MGARRRAREAALQILYCMDSTGVSAVEAEREHWSHLASSVEGKDYAHQIISAYAKDPEKVDAAIKQASEHWRIERMPVVDRNILRVGVVELLYLSEVPRRVTLNEAVELAKRYSGENSPSFVNGVLDRIAEQAGKA